MQAAEEVGKERGVAPVRTVLLALGLSRAAYYRRQRRQRRKQPKQPKQGAVPVVRNKRACPVPARRLSEEEREAVCQTLYSERFTDRTPAEVYAALLDEGVYLCSVRTMYRILAEEGASKRRTRERKHGQFARPELLAERPNQLWSWDITRLKGPCPWTYFYLYVIMDVFSRYVVGYTIAYQESHALAKEFIAETIKKQNIAPDQLTLHADRGSSMTSKGVALLLSDLGVVKTHSRPHVSNDNPYSESQFKTLKYRPEFPERFGTIEGARSLCGKLFDWYNGEHHHGGLALLTPATVHHGRADEVIERRQARLDAAYRANPSRFVNRPPRHPALPSAVYINPPAPSEET
jgi:putative transposase